MCVCVSECVCVCVCVCVLGGDANRCTIIMYMVSVHSQIPLNNAALIP